MASKRKFRHQDVSTPGPGTKVRTVRAGAHQIRIAFPKGARKRGAGKIVSILHPATEKNPICEGLTLTEVQSLEIPVSMASSPDLGAAIQEILESPSAELAANPVDLAAKWNELRSKLAAWIVPKHSAVNPERGQVQEIAGSQYTLSTSYTDRQNVSYELYKQASGLEGKGAIVVRDLDSNHVIHVVTYPTFQKARYEYKRTLKIARKNPKRKSPGYGRDRNPKGKKSKRNLDEIERAAQLTERFRGYPAERITESGEPNTMRDDYAHLGWTEQLVFVPASLHEELDCEEISDLYNEAYQDSGDSKKAWREVEEEFGIPLRVYDVAGDEIRLAASADGEQLYFLGGKQAQFKEFLSDFDVDASKDRVSLGVLLCVVYSAQKVQAGDEEERGYYHVFGEEGGYPPGAYFDLLNNRIMLFGGTYHLNEAERGIKN